ncbi:TIR domain-containing protein [Clostridiaceae bacterium]|nr:TIR domain-containing protein [Clostridiaceae bacterium]NBI81398.1 TIR domain-containing protein [Clostridiaceae bacterium]RKJ60830.1 TIR domain-containing protein [Butyricicoccus sp. 1XD8-22]
MVFIGYSSKERYSVVEPILFHLKHFGLDVWYDFHDMFLGDDRYQINFKQGIGKSSYVIFIISPHFFESKCAMDELNYAKRMIENRSTVIFPIFYEMKPSELPQKFNWLCNIIYNEVDSSSGTKHVAYQIIERIFQDELQQYPYKELSTFSKEHIFSDRYIDRVIESWAAVDERNFGVRIGILYSLYLYFPCVETKYSKAINYIFLLLQMNENINHLIYSIFEKSILAYCIQQLKCCQLEQF